MVAAISVVARANIALVKYWGKSDSGSNLPAVGSLSLTLDGLRTETTLEVQGGSACVQTGDLLILDGKAQSGVVAQRITAFCELFRRLYNDHTSFVIRSVNHFPTAAGLASSASGFAALGKALAEFYGLSDEHQLVNLVRQGSGSAPRSLRGGFVHLVRGDNDISLQSPPTNLAGQVVLLVLVTDEGRKAIGSREAMERTRRSSPYWQAWQTQQPKDLACALEALQQDNFATLGQIAEQNALAMHALCHSSWPPVIYWNAASITLLDEVQKLRDSGTRLYATMDAGPQVKLLVRREDLDEVSAHFATRYPEVRQIPCLSGSGASLVS